MITIQDGHMVPLPFGSFSDPGTGRVQIRLVELESSSYRVAREYMIRLDRQDLADPDRLRPIAQASGLTPEACHDRYGYLPRAEPRPTSGSEYSRRPVAAKMALAIAGASAVCGVPPTPAEGRSGRSRSTTSTFGASATLGTW